MKNIVMAIATAVIVTGMISPMTARSEIKDTKATYVARAGQLLGLASPPKVIYDGFEGSSPIGVAHDAMGSRTMNSGDTYTFATSSTANTYCQQWHKSPNLLFPGRPDSVGWYMATRISIGGTFSATSIAAIELADAANQHYVILGGVGAASATAFSARVGGNDVVGSTAVSPSGFHVLEAYQLDGRVHVIVDGSEIGDAAIGDIDEWAGGTFLKSMVAYNGANGGGLSTTQDWWIFVLANG